MYVFIAGNYSISLVRMKRRDRKHASQKSFSILVSASCEKEGYKKCESYLKMFFFSQLDRKIIWIAISKNKILKYPIMSFSFIYHINF